MLLRRPQLVDFSCVRVASAATDLLTFIHTAGGSGAREDFLIRCIHPSPAPRFVYYESLVTSLKALRYTEPIITYDDLKVGVETHHPGLG